MLEKTSPQQKIRVGLTGAGSMGKGIAGQIYATKGMELAWVMDIDSEAAATAAQLGHCSHMVQILNNYSAITPSMFL